MLWWDQKFKKLMVDLQLQLDMYLRYVDDQNLVTRAVQPGTRYIEGKLVVEQDLVDFDIARPRDQVTADLIRTIANTITPMIQLEEDVPSKHSSNKLPILDLEVWNKDGMIETTFYKKPMATKRTIMARSAYPTNKKRHVLVEEAMRRLRNCTPEQPWACKAEHLTTFAIEMQAGGHREHFRKTVLDKAVSKYKKELEAHLSGKKDIYRSQRIREEESLAKGGKADKTDWMTRLGAGYTSVLTLPATAEGRLAQEVEKELESCPKPKGTREKVVEASGRAVRQEICPSDPFPRARCHREDCVPDLSKEGGSRGQCNATNSNYLFKCRRCEADLEDKMKNSMEEQNGLTRRLYRGETSRTMYTRAAGHMAKYRARDNFMWDHTLEYHGGVLGPGDGLSDYIMELESRQKNSFSRQIRESVLIKRNQEGKDKDKVVKQVSQEEGRQGEDKKIVELEIELFNGRGEWFAPKHVEVIFHQL